MISEINFSRGYTSFWSEYTPWINDYVGSIVKEFSIKIQIPIELADNAMYRSINNVIAFTHFKNRILLENDDLKLAKKEAYDIIKNFPRSNLKSFTLSTDNIQLIKMLSDRMVNQYRSKSVGFYPQFWGCGILESCQGDLYYNETLVEIKAGERSILASDIKQIITYCALNWLSNEPITIKHIEFYNPRQGILWNTNLNEMILSISNLPPEDLFDQIGKYLSVLSEDIDLH